MGDFLEMPGPNIKIGNHWGLLVDRNGERFMNEYCVRAQAGMNGNLADGGTCYAIWDAGYAAHLSATTPWLKAADIPSNAAVLVERWDKDVEAGKATTKTAGMQQAGTYVKADTLEGVIEALGLPTSAIDTVKHYNEMAKNGKDEDFFKPAKYLHEIKEGPFYGHKRDGKVFLTILGGLRTNANMQVCDEKDNPIPSLYNVGTMVGDLYSGNYTFQMEGVNYGMACLTFGYLP